MKRIVFLLMVVIGGLPIIAQTNFRSLTLDEAIQAAKSENKLVFIDFYTTWCGPCKMMMKNVFPQPKVGEYFNNKYVCIKLDAEKEGKEVAMLTLALWFHAFPNPLLGETFLITWEPPKFLVFI